MDVPTTSVDFLATNSTESADEPRRSRKRVLSSDAENIEGQPKLKAARKYGPNKKHVNLPPDVVEEKRLRANEQERVRQKQIADALEVLKSLDMPFNPNLPNHKEDSKLYTICTATAYIAAMTKMIEDHDNGIVHPEQLLAPPQSQLSVPPRTEPMNIYSDAQNVHMAPGASMQPVPSCASNHAPQQSYFGAPNTSCQMRPPRRALADTTNDQHQGLRSFCNGPNQPGNSRMDHQHQMQGVQRNRYGHATPSGFYPTAHEVMTYQPVATRDRYYTPSTPMQMSYGPTPDRSLRPTTLSPNDQYFIGMSPGANSHNPVPSMANISPVGGSFLSPPHLHSPSQYSINTPFHSRPQFSRSIPLHSTPQYSRGKPLPENGGTPSPVIRQPFFSSPTTSLAVSRTESGYGSSFASGSSGNNSNTSGASYSQVDRDNHINNSMNYNPSFLNASPFQQTRFTQ